MTKRILNTYTEYVEPSDLFTEVEQLDQCCETVSADPCVEVGRSEPYVSADKEDLNLEKLLNEARAAHPGKNIVGVQVVDVGPKGDCGTMYTEWSGRENCCDGVEPLGVNTDESVEILGDFSSGVIAITGGRPPFNISVRGSGFFLNSNHSFRDGVVSGRLFSVFTADACGPCDVSIGDGCSSVTASLKSENGNWVQVFGTNDGGASNYPGGCPAIFEESTPVSSSISERYYGETGRWKVDQFYVRGVSRDSAARRPYDGVSVTNYKNAIDTCWQYANASLPIGVTEERLTGGCFTFEQTCMSCGNECTDISDEYRFSNDLGYHSLITRNCTATDGWCLIIGGWSIVQSTKIYEWRC